jgi:hypothetical protein
MSKNLQSINYDTKLNIDDFKFESDSRENDLLQRTKIGIGEYSGIEPRYGIVDQLDPKDLVETDITRPLLVKISEVDILRVTVTPGVVICPNGSICHLQNQITDFELARTNIDDVVVVFLENEIIAGGESRLSKYQVAAKTRYIQSTEILRSALLTDYNNLSLFSLTRKENIVVIAVAKVVSGLSGTELLLDYTNNIYPFNRPWFSIVDVEHRNSKGSGLVTSRNPHGTTFNDLSTGEIPFYSQISGVGSILSKDIDLKGRAGYACVEQIDISRYQTDPDGSITGESRFGGMGARYFLLANYPTSVSSMHVANHKSRSIAFDWIKGTKIVVLQPSEITDTNPTTYTSSTIYYNRVNALEIPQFINGNKITFGQPNQESEFIVSGGLSYVTLPNTTVEFEGTGPVARKFKVYLNDTGDLIKFPQVLQNTILLDSVGGDYVSLDVNQFGPAQLSIALADAISSSNLKVTIRIFGTNTSDVVISEDLTFDSSWVSVVLPNIENLQNIIKTENVFNTITGFQVIERVSDGAASKIIIYAEVESGTAQRLNSLALVAKVDWDGLSIGNLRDERNIKTYYPGYSYRYEGAASLQYIGTYNYLLTEEYESPRHNEVVPSNQEGTAASTFISFSDDVSNGDWIDLTPTPNEKRLIAVSSSPTRSLGQFQRGLASQTRDDIIATINDPAFASGFTATPDTASNRLKLTRNIIGNSGNSVLNLNVTITGAIAIEGNAVGGYDPFGEAVVPHHSNRLNSVIPLTSVYDVSYIRDRYMSRAIPIKLKKTIRIILHGVYSPYNMVQLRYRISNEKVDWLPWQVANLTSPLFTVTSASNITKIQVQVFGKFDGFSLYEVI